MFSYQLNAEEKTRLLPTPLSQLGINVIEIGEGRGIEGEVITSKIPKGPGDFSGLRIQDVIIGIDNQPMRQTKTIVNFLKQKHQGDAIVLEILRYKTGDPHSRESYEILEIPATVSGEK